MNNDRRSHQVSERANVMSTLSTSENIQKATGILKWSWGLIKVAECTVREHGVDLCMWPSLYCHCDE